MGKILQFWWHLATFFPPRKNVGYFFSKRDINWNEYSNSKHCYGCNEMNVWYSTIFKIV